MRFQPEILMSAGDMSGNLSSTPVELTFLIDYAIQAVYTGSPVGALTLEASVDGTNYTTVTDSSSAVSSASNTMWNVQNAGYKWVRVNYTRTSGTGSLTVKFFGKGG